VQGARAGEEKQDGGRVKGSENENERRSRWVKLTESESGCRE
jgi:hypothetical protein